MEAKKRRIIWHMAWLLPLLLFCIVASAAVGSAEVTMIDSFKLQVKKIPIINQYIDVSNIKSVYATIVWQVRMPRIIMAALVGGGLAVVGACFQGLFRNPLADPHILGVSSGAALGATLSMLFGFGISWIGIGTIGIAAFIGALVTVLIVYQVACIGNQVSVVHILLTGTAISSLISAIISLLMSLHHEKIEKVYLWTLGSFSSASWQKNLFLCVITIICVATVVMFSKDLDMIVTGEETAQSLGVDTAMVKRIVIIASSLLVAACVSVSGVIGFVGLIIPHCIRLLSGVRHGKVIPLCMVGGAIFMVVCDTISRTIIAPSEIPVGVVTAIFGAPYFILLLQKKKGKVG